MSARRVARAFLVAAAVSAAAGEVWAQPSVLFRIFLKDGSSLASFGEFARVNDRVVFSMPIGPVESARTPALTLVSLPAAEVDWAATEQYTERVRAAQYAATRGEADYAVLADRVARMLQDLAASGDPAERLKIAVEARRAVADWSQKSYGYRARDIADLSGLLDEVVSELRAATGDASVELHFVAGAVSPPDGPLLPPPTLQESIEQVLRAARLAPDAAGRMDLLRTAVLVVDEHRASLDGRWAAETRREAAGALAAELRTEQAYTRLAARLLADAGRAVGRADVAGVERIVARALEADRALGGRRPDIVGPLVATLRERLEEARRLRLARDAEALRAAAARAYRASVEGAVARAGQVRAALDAIRRLDGPPPERLPRVERELAAAARTLAGVHPPDALRAVHAMLTSAVHLAREACRLRHEAVARDDMTVAWNASASAAGALVLLDRARQELDGWVKSPRVP